MILQKLIVDLTLVVVFFKFKERPGNLKKVFNLPLYISI